MGSRIASTISATIAPMATMMAGSSSDSAAEVKHGPMAIVGAGFPVLMLPPNDEAGEAFAPLADDFAERGAQVLRAGDTLPALTHAHPALMPIATILSFYRMTAALSLARGFDPDRPPHLQKVTSTR